MRKLMILFVLIATPLFAVQPDEILDDPVLEARARVISKGLRCLVCRNENIDDSNAPLARDLRVLVRERLVAGDTNPEVIQFVVDRYGEFVLLKPKTTGANMILWATGPVLLLLALGVGYGFIRSRRPVDAKTLSEDEKNRLAEILKS
ncbi:MAG: cytochrome c-type biogenesis protein CcmH [Paracoccaceae bacterium]